MKTAVLVVNLGTPDAPTPSKVRTYLREFLSDPRVIDIPALGRWLLLNLIILPFRPRKSAAAYAKIWTPEGSPLLENTRVFTEKLRAALPKHFAVDFAMRYGNPSLESKLETLLAGSPDELILLPMYPQYSAASTGSTLDRIYTLLKGRWNIPAVRTIGPFHGDAGFLDACAEIGRPYLQSAAPDHVVFSYHGLPERQIRRGESVEGHCLKADESCCATLSAKNNYCYRAQCYETSRQLARRLGLTPAQYTVSFQSRLGRTPWIKPYTDLVLTELGKQGKQTLLVFEPSFTADCLETLEEITFRGSETFLAAGGRKLVLVPSLNSEDAWVKAARDLVIKAAAPASN